MSDPERIPTNAGPPPTDLGFGGSLSRGGRSRLLQRDGTFSARRVGLRFVESVGVYSYLLTTSWPKFLGLVALAYFGTNAVFATGYLLLGPDALKGGVATTIAGRFIDAFFFSVHTLATIGYGNIVPHSMAANILGAFESLVGLLGAAAAAGVVFARISRPRAGVVFSDVATIAPYQGGKALMFRLANARHTELIQVAVVVNISLLKADGSSREFMRLTLERDEVVFMPTTWTVVHPIDRASPLFGLDAETLMARAPELFVLLTAVEEVFGETVHTRMSYAGAEIVWGARFANISEVDQSGVVTKVDVSRISEIDRVPLPV